MNSIVLIVALLSLILDTGCDKIDKGLSPRADITLEEPRLQIHFPKFIRDGQSKADLPFKGNESSDELPGKNDDGYGNSGIGSEKSENNTADAFNKNESSFKDDAFTKQLINTRDSSKDELLTQPSRPNIQFDEELNAKGDETSNSPLLKTTNKLDDVVRNADDEFKLSIRRNGKLGDNLSGSDTSFKLPNETEQNKKSSVQQTRKNLKATNADDVIKSFSSPKTLRKHLNLLSSLFRRKLNLNGLGEDLKSLKQNPGKKNLATPFQGSDSSSSGSDGSSSSGSNSGSSSGSSSGSGSGSGSGSSSSESNENCAVGDWIHRNRCKSDDDCCSLSCCESNVCTPFFLSISCKLNKIGGIFS